MEILFLLKICEEYGRDRCINIGGNMICSSLTNDNFHKYISKMGNNLTPYSIAIGEENIYFVIPHFKFIKRNRINDSKFLITNKGSVDPYDYHLSNCGKESFKKLRFYKLHSNGKL